MAKASFGSGRWLPAATSFLTTSIRKHVARWLLSRSFARFRDVPMSAFGPKRTSLVAPHMSAFGGKADMMFCERPLSQSLLGVKRTCRFALHILLLTQSEHRP